VYDIKAVTIAANEEKLRILKHSYVFKKSVNDYGDESKRFNVGSLHEEFFHINPLLIIVKKKYGMFNPVADFPVEVASFFNGSISNSTASDMCYTFRDE
jgi:hypothetical protein